VLVAPPKAPAKLGGTVAIAWNGSAQAARAVEGALPFLAGAKVTVLTAAEKDEFVAAPAELSAYLAWHGVSASTATVEADSDAAGEALLAEAGKLGADLLVMGGYGHSRVREVILGGVTYHVLGNAEIPVLMAH
jgi:nucleotide-binding universal stress UspA family protein